MRLGTLVEKDVVTANSKACLFGQADAVANDDARSQDLVIGCQGIIGYRRDFDFYNAVFKFSEILHFPSLYIHQKAVPYSFLSQEFKPKCTYLSITKTHKPDIIKSERTCST